MTRHDALLYEVAASSWWIERCSWRWLQRLAGRYMARKVSRKWARCEAVQQRVEFIRSISGTIPPRQP